MTCAQGAGEVAHADWGVRRPPRHDPSANDCVAGTADQFDHNDTSLDPSVLPLVAWQVSHCHLSTFLVLSSEYRIAVQAGSANVWVSETRFDELHVPQADILMAASAYRHHDMPPPPTKWTPHRHHRHIVHTATHLDPVPVPAVKGFYGGPR